MAPQDILRICREKTHPSNGDETFVSLSDGFELHGDGETEEIVVSTSPVSFIIPSLSSPHL